MEQAEATQLANQWVRAHADDIQQAQAAYHALSVELTGLLPDDGAYAVVLIEDHPVIVAVITGAVITLRVDGVADLADGEQRLKLSAGRHPLNAQTCIVSLDEEIHWRQGGATRTRRWRFDLVPGEDSLEFETSEPLQAMFSSDAAPGPDEVAARAIAREVGWPVPEPDPSPSAYR